MPGSGWLNDREAWRVETTWVQLLRIGIYSGSGPEHNALGSGNTVAGRSTQRGRRFFARSTGLIHREKVGVPSGPGDEDAYIDERRVRRDALWRRSEHADRRQRGSENENP